MHRHLFPLIILIAVLTGVLWGTANTPWLLSWYVPQFCKSNFKSVELTTFSVGKQAFSFPETITLYDVKATFSFQGKEEQVTAKRIVVHDFVSYWRSGEQVRISANGLDLKFSSLEVTNAEVKALVVFRNAHPVAGEGVLAAARVKFARYLLDNVTARVGGNQSKFEISELSFDGYGGFLQGQITFEKLADPNYIVWLELADLTSQELRAIDTDFFSKIDGIFKGTLRVVGDLRQVSLLAVTLNTSAGGSVTAPLVKELSGQMKDDPVPKGVLTALSGKGNTPVGKMTLMLQSSNNNRLTVHYDLEDTNSGLQIKTSREVYLADGLRNVLFADR